MKKLVLSFLVFAALGASAQKVSNKFGLKPGQTVEMVSDMSMTSEMPMMGESKNSFKTTEVYAVKAVNGGNTTIEKSIKNIKLNVSVMGQDQVIDSDKPEDLKGQSGEAVKAILSHKQQFTIDPNGTITAITAAETKKSTDNMVAAMMEQMNGNSPMAVGVGSPMKVLPSYAVGIGDSWSDTTSDARGKTQTTYTVKSISGSDMLVDYISNGTIDTKQEMMGMNAEIKGTVKGNGVVTVDAATGLPKQKTINSATDMAMSISGQDMNITTKTVGTSVFTIR